LEVTKSLQIITEILQDVPLLNFHSFLLHRVALVMTDTLTTYPRCPYLHGPAWHHKTATNT